MRVVNRRAYRWLGDLLFSRKRFEVARIALLSILNSLLAVHLQLGILDRLMVILLVLLTVLWITR